MNLRLRLPFGWKVPLTNGLRGINIPLIPFKKIDRYMARCERFKPRLRAKDLEGKSKRQVRLMLSVEVERIRAAMNLMTDELKSASALTRPPPPTGPTTLWLNIRRADTIGNHAFATYLGAVCARSTCAGGRFGIKLSAA
ncbi:MAG: hypothetical protein IPN06_20695 [Burkholderiales bacterium]|nr:hypothetical protein [Burkholderiales bacterium]